MHILPPTQPKIINPYNFMPLRDNGIMRGVGRGVGNLRGFQGGFLPTDVAGLTDWFAPRLEGLSNPIANIPNRVSGGTDLTQATADQQGTLDAASLNGEDGIDLDFNDEYACNFDCTTNGSFSGLLVFDCNDNAGVRLTNNDAGSTGAPSIYMPGSNKITIELLGTGDQLASTTSIATGQVHIIWIESGANGSAIFLNGGSADNSTATTSTYTSNVDRFGRDSGFGWSNNILYEWMWFNVDNVSTANKNLLGNYVADIYNQTWTDIP